MEKRKELKAKAKVALKHQYFKAVILCFIFTVVFGGGYTFVSKPIFYNEKNSVLLKDSLHKVEKIDREDLSGSVFRPLEDKINSTPKKKYTRGVLAIFANQVNMTGSFILGVLNAFNQIMFHGSVSATLLILLGVIIELFVFIFIKNILTVGKSRYFLENRKYKKTEFDKLLFIYRVKRTLNVARAMLRVTIYELLWTFTIVGGFIKHYSYRLVPYILAENPSISGKDAIDLSKKMMNGYKWYAFRLDLSLIPWFILGIFTFQFTDVLFLTPYSETILAEFYMQVRALAKKKQIEKIELLNDSLLEGEEENKKYPMDQFSIPEKEYREWLHISYKRNYSVQTFILLFFTFAIVGWVWEVSLHLFTDGEFVNRGTLFGPWLPIYGWGGILILILLKPFREKPWLTFLLATVICGIVEYSTAWYLETFKHMKWWDYTGYFLNLDGRICLEGLLVFGLGGCGFTYLFAPILDNIYRKIPFDIKTLVCAVLITFFILDNIYSHYHPNSGKGITDYQSYHSMIVKKNIIVYNTQ